MAELDPHAALGAAEVGPGESPPSRAWSIGPARGRWRTAASGRRGGGCLRPHGKPCWPMRSTPWESIPATSPRPRTTRMSSGACGRPSRKRSETASACGTSPKAQPRTHTPPQHPTSVGAPTSATPTAPQEPCAPHNTTRLTPRPAAPPSNPVTQQTTTTGRHARPRPEVAKRTGRRRKPTHTTTSTTTPKGAEPRPATVGSSPPSARHRRRWRHSSAVPPPTPPPRPPPLPQERSLGWCALRAPLPWSLWVWWCAWGALRARGAVCCLVLQAPVGRLGEPDSEPTGGVAGLDTPPPGLPTCRRLPTTAIGRGWPSPTHDWGRSALPDCTGTGGAALGWTSLPR